jgi:hypothetical protein
MRSIAHRADGPATDVPRTRRIAVAISAYSLGGANRRDADNNYRCGETSCREIESHDYPFEMPFAVMGNSLYPRVLKCWSIQTASGKS